MPFVVIAFVIAAALGGGTATFAQHAMPGTALWGFKVNVTEQLAGALASSDTDKAQWDLAAIQTRLSEAQTLKAKGLLTAQVQADIAANIQKHDANLTAIVARLEQGGSTQHAVDIATRYQATLADIPTQTYAGTLAAMLQNALEQASSLSASVSASMR